MPSSRCSCSRFLVLLSALAVVFLLAAPPRAAADSVTYDVSSSIFVFAPGSIVTIADGIVTVDATLQGTTYDGVMADQGSDTFRFTNSDNSYLSFTFPVSLADFSGGDVFLGYATALVCSGGDGAILCQRSSGFGTATLTAEAPVAAPEPSALVFLLSGALLFFVLKLSPRALGLVRQSAAA